MTLRKVELALVALLIGASHTALCGDFRINLPKHSRVTPVQQLNREGVNEAKRGRLSKAKERFLKAYLLDPNDPFTLNNLGYIAELEGDVDRALRYYQLAGQVDTEAVIDSATSAGLKGHPVAAAFQSSEVSAYQANRANFRAMSLIEKGRVFEAELVLRDAIHADPRNPFLLDSMGYVMESEGNLTDALTYYTQAASMHSDERVFLTPNKKWRGRTITDISTRSAAAVQDALTKGEDTETRVTRLNLQGVSALNHADTLTAQKFFTSAYQLDPRNAFTLNNLGYISELKGDRETAEMNYDAAQSGQQANDRVTYATRKDAEGRRLGSVAEGNEDEVAVTLKAIQQKKKQNRKPIRLMVRNSGVTPATEGNPIPRVPGLLLPQLPIPTLPERDATPNQSKPSEPKEPSIQLLNPGPQAISPGQPQPQSPAADH